MIRNSFLIKKTYCIFLIFLILVAGCIESKKVKEDVKSGSHFNTRDNLLDVDFINSEDGWIVGSWGGIYRTNDHGKHWIKQNSGTQFALCGVSFVDELKGWCVGSNGIILRTQDGGNSWNKLNSIKNNDLYKVQFVDANNGWAVGTWGTIIHTSDGGNTWEDQSWKDQSQVDTPNFRGLSFINKEQGWVAGEFGVILHTEDGGKNWMKQDGIVNDRTIFGVCFKNKNIGVVVGMEGMIFYTKNGGETWKSCVSPTNLSLLDVSICEDQIWAVGIRGEIVKGKLDDSKNIIGLDIFNPENKTFRYLSGIACFGNSICIVGAHATIRQYSN